MHTQPDILQQTRAEKQESSFKSDSKINEVLKQTKPSFELLSVLMDNIPDYIYFKDTESRFIKVNKNAAWALGAQHPDDVIGKTDFDFLPDIAQRTKDDEKQIMQSGKPQINEPIEVIFADGNKHWVSVTKVPFYDEDGNVAGIAGISRDITQNKNLNLKLEQNESILRAFMDSSSEGFAILDNKLNFIHCNNTGAKIIGYSSARDLLGKNVVDISPNIKSSGRYTLYKKVIQTGEPIEFLDLKTHPKLGNIHLNLKAFKVNDGLGIIIQDITDTNLIKQKIKQTEDSYKTIFNASTDSIFLHDFSSGEIIDVNDTVIKKFGYTEQEIKNLNVGDLSINIPPYTQKEAVDWIHKAVQNGPQHFEWLAKAKNGELIWFENCLQKIRISNNERILVIGRDITERKKYEEELKRNQTLLKETEKISGVGGWVWDIKNQHSEWTDTVYEIYGVDKTFDTSNLKKILSFFPKEDQEKILTAFTKCINHNISYDMTVRFTNAKGKKLWCQIMGTPIIENGKTTKIQGFFFDVTKQKQQEILLKESEKKLRTIIEHSNEVYYIHDTNHKLTYVSPQCKKIFGYTKKEMMIKWTDLITENPINQIGIQKTENAIKTGKKQKPYFLEIKHKNGQHKIIEIDESPIKNDGGMVIGITGAARDITTQKHAEDALKKSETKFRKLFNGFSDPIFVHDLQGHLIDVNTATIKKYGYTKKEIFKLNLQKFYAPEHFKKVKQELSTLQKNKSITFETVHHLKDGRQFPVEIRSTLINIDNKLVALSLCHDIKNRKMAEEKINNITNRLKTIIDSSPSGIITIDTQGKITSWSPANKKIFGWSEQEVLGKLNPIVPPHLIKGLKQKMLESYKGYELQAVRKDKTKINISLSSVPLKDSKNQIIGAIGIVEDITDRKKIENELRANEEKFRTIFEEANDGIALLNMKGYIVDANNKAAEIFGGKKEEFIGKHFSRVSTIPKKQLPKLIIQFKNFISGSSQPMNFWMINKQNKKLFLECSGAIIHNEQNKNLLTVIVRDETERKKTHDEIIKTHQELQNLNQDLEKRVLERTQEIQTLLKQKDEFIKQLGHDLKNPIGPLINLLPLLEKNADNQIDKEMFQIINRNVKYMKNLITKTLELARLNSPNTQFTFETIDLKENLDTIIKNNSLLYLTKNIHITNNLDSKLYLAVDKLRIEELFNNILNNAIKYTDDNGKITIKGTPKKDHIHITITDNGIGMTKNQINNVFNEFYKADPSRHDFDSSGLGLPICKQIITKHHGNIWAESKGLGKGTTIHITLPTTQNNGGS